MTTTQNPQGKSSIRRRLAVTAVTTVLGLGTLGVTFGVSTSPGRVRTSDRSAELAIPGVRGTGGGGGGAIAARKAGGGSFEY